MGGGPFYVGGIEFARMSSEPSVDATLCAVFSRMTECVSNDQVREALQAVVSREGTVRLPSIAVKSGGGGGGGERTDAVTIIGGPWQASLPESDGRPLALAVRDSSICLALLVGADYLGDSSLLIRIVETAKEQLERMTLDFVQAVAAQVVPQAVSVWLTAECDQVQVSWANNLETEVVEILRRAGDQSEGQGIASLEGSPTTYDDTTVQSVTIYTYTVKDYGKGALLAIGDSEQVEVPECASG